MKNILYIANNNSSDTRIYKELKSLNEEFYISYLGINSSSKNADSFFGKKYCKNFFLINGKAKNPLTLLKFVLKAYYIILKFNINSLHIVNEQIFFLIYPISFFKRCVLDQFDSIFYNRLNFLRRIPFFLYFFYKPLKKIIVTDLNRKFLMPSYYHDKILILPNYPIYRQTVMKKEKTNNLSILYFGWLGKSRGSELISGLLNLNKGLRIFSAGWIGDNYTKILFEKYDKVINYSGVLNQYEALKLSQKVDYIICVYEPNSINNINASPNKIYDAIQIQTPVIINSEVKISKFVDKINLGYIIKDYYKINYENLYNDLVKNRLSYQIDNDLRKKYCWEAIDHNLLSSHKF
jgi:hypothetical protein